MRKLNSLRAAIEAAVPELAQNPANLRIWVDRGTMAATLTNAGGMTFAYRANVLIMEMTADLSVVTHALTTWLRVEQPDRLIPGTEGLSFEVDVLTNKVVDVLLQVDLKESVTATPNEDGSIALAYLSEPDPLFDDFGSAGPTDPPPPLTAVGQEGEGWLAAIDGQM